MYVSTASPYVLHYVCPVQTGLVSSSRESEWWPAFVAARLSTVTSITVGTAGGGGSCRFGLSARSHLTHGRGRGAGSGRVTAPSRSPPTHQLAKTDSGYHHQQLGRHWPSFARRREIKLSLSNYCCRNRVERRMVSIFRTVAVIATVVFNIYRHRGGSAGRWIGWWAGRAAVTASLIDNASSPSLSLPAAGPASSRPTVAFVLDPVAVADSRISRRILCPPKIRRNNSG